MPQEMEVRKTSAEGGNPSLKQMYQSLLEYMEEEENYYRDVTLVLHENIEIYEKAEMYDVARIEREVAKMTANIYKKLITISFVLRNIIDSIKEECE